MRIILGIAVNHYSKLFKRVAKILRTRYRIKLNVKDWENLETWIGDELSNILDKKIHFKVLEMELENLRRHQPAKFYMLEQDLIKEFRNQVDKLKKADVKIIIPRIGILDKKPKNNKDKKDSDKEGGDYITIS